MAKAERPDGGTHQVHAEKAGDNEIDVARAGLVHLFVLRGDGCVLAVGLLDGVVGDELRGAGVGVGVVVIKLDAAGLLHGEHEDFSERERFSALGFVQCCGAKALIRVECLGDLRSRAADLQDIRGTIAEGDTEPDGEQEGKDEDPEDGFGLAEEEAEALRGELVERAGGEATHREASFR